SPRVMPPLPGVDNISIACNCLSLNLRLLIHYHLLLLIILYTPTMPLFVHITPIQASYADSLYVSHVRLHNAYMSSIYYLRISTPIYPIDSPIFFLLSPIIYPVRYIRYSLKDSASFGACAPCCRCLPCINSYWRICPTHEPLGE